jgi:hypothetical protein
MSNKKVLVLVLSTNADPWRKIELLGQDTTWKLKTVQGVEVMRYYSTGKNVIVKLASKIYWNLEKIILNKYPGNRISRLWKKYIEMVEVEVTIDTRQIVLSLNETYPLIGLKTIRAFEAILKLKHFDYVYRTNVSSYLDLHRLAKFVSFFTYN